MVLAVSDTSSNRNDNIENAAKIIGRSTIRRAIFNAIYHGKKAIKSAKAIAVQLRVPEKRILTEAKRFVDAGLVDQVKVDRRMAYKKLDFFHLHKRKILGLVDSPAKLRRFPTKTKTAADVKMPKVVHLKVISSKARALSLTIDDIDSFDKVKKVLSATSVKMAEARFKEGIRRILGEIGRFQDWGGEISDLFSSRLRIRGIRRVVAFAFKGPGKKGPLVPGKMGKHGDQIQRLMRCPAEVFVVQYWAQVEETVFEQLAMLARAKAAVEGRPIWYCVIDGQDSARLIKAYPKAFT